MNYESFLQFVMDCEDIQDHSNNSNNLQGSVEIQLACDTITAISRCMIDKNEQLDILQLFQCELQKSETDFCTGADDVEIGLMTAKNQTQLYPYHFKKEKLAQLLFPKTTILQKQFLQDDIVQINNTNFAVKGPLSDMRQDGGVESSSKLGVLNFFLYCGLMLLLLGIAIGLFQACQLLSRYSSEEGSCQLIVVRTDPQQPAATPQVYYRRGTTGTYSVDSALRNYYRSLQTAQERQPLLGARRQPASEPRRMVTVRQPLVAHAHHSSSFHVASRSLNDQLWWSGQVPLQSQSNTSALEQFISSLDAYIYRVDNKEICTVCLEDIKQEDKVVALPCCHVFHSPCIVQWIRTRGVNASCPVCNARLMDDFLTT